MDDMQTIITLLTVVVVLLSIVIIALIAAIIILIVKVNKLVSDAQHVTSNLAAATKWLNPVTVFTELMNAIRRN